MEESKDLIVGYKIFRSLVYVSLILEFFLYAVDPAVLDFWGGILMDLHARMKRWFIYADGNLIWSKVATLLLICITCIGTRNKKKLEFDARKMVLYPLVSGLFIVVLSVWLFGHAMGPHIYTINLNRWLRPGQHFEVPQGGPAEGPVQLRERVLRPVREEDRERLQRQCPDALLL